MTTATATVSPTPHWDAMLLRAFGSEAVVEAFRGMVTASFSGSSREPVSPDGRTTPEYLPFPDGDAA